MSPAKKPTPDPQEAKPTPRPASGVTMDIIPKHKVRPTTTSRPVITNSGPGVPDNTLTQPASAPLLNRKRLTLAPLNDDAAPEEPAEAPIVAPEVSSTQPTTAPTVAKGKGVSVEDLIAKRQQKDDELKEAPAELSAPTPEPEPEAEPAETEAPAMAPARPAPSELFEEVAADRAAAAQAASLLADEPAGATESESKPTSVPAPEPVAEQPPVLEKAPQAPTSSAVADLLKEDEPEQPQEHSQALKDELKEMDANGGPKTHHELYGGKPVIIVHKDHGMSAMAWVLWFVFCVALALVVVNFLIDAEIITTDYNIPHTNII